MDQLRQNGKTRLVFAHLTGINPDEYAEDPDRGPDEITDSLYGGDGSGDFSTTHNQGTA